MKNITEINRKHIFKGSNRLAFHFKPVNIVGMVDETQEDQEKFGKKRKILETGTGKSPNP